MWKLLFKCKRHHRRLMIMNLRHWTREANLPSQWSSPPISPHSLELDLWGSGPSHFSPETDREKRQKSQSVTWQVYPMPELTKSTTVSWSSAILVEYFATVQNRSLTNAVGHQLKSVRSKKWLWLPIYMAHNQGEAKRLEGVGKTWSE